MEPNEVDRSDGEGANGVVFHHALGFEDLVERGQIMVDVGGIEFGLFYDEGDVYPVSNYCVHQGDPLREGELTGVLRADGDTICDTTTSSRS